MDHDEDEEPVKETSSETVVTTEEAKRLGQYLSTLMQRQHHPSTTQPGFQTQHPW